MNTKLQNNLETKRKEREPACELLFAYGVRDFNNVWEPLIIMIMFANCDSRKVLHGFMLKFVQSEICSSWINGIRFFKI